MTETITIETPQRLWDELPNAEKQVAKPNFCGQVGSGNLEEN